MHVKPGSTAAALVLCLALAAPARAADAAGPELKAEIDGMLGKLATTTRGLIKWDGADRMDIREEGDAAIADIGNARISIGSEGDKPPAKRAQISFDHIEIRRAPGPGGSIALSVVLPAESILHAADGGETRLTLKNATGKVVLDAQSSRASETGLAFDSARIDEKASGDWITFGPLSLSSKLVAAADGGWTAPIDFTLKEVKFLASEVPAGGAIDRIAYTARTAGPDLAALNRLRDRIDALRQEGDNPAKAQPDALRELLPGLISLFSTAKGELTIEGLAVRRPTGEPFFALKKASLGGALTGLSGKEAALRVTLQHDGLTVAPTLLDAGRVPRSAVFDIGLENVDTGALRSILDAAGTMGEGASEADKQHAEEQAIAAAAALNPALRLHDLALDTPDVGIKATGQAAGSPLSPKGYTAAADVAVRGFDALPGLVGDSSLASYLPILKEIGTPAAAADGTQRIGFHLASAPPKWITVNGSDVSAWFAGDNAAAGQTRDLRPAEPAMSGADVSAVQKALAAAEIDAPQNGIYDPATALAVARFQKAKAINVDGVVDAATRQKLGVKPQPPAPNPAAPRPGSQGDRPTRPN